MGKKYRGVGTIRWLAKDGEDGKPGKDGSNYLIMGWWSANVHYKLTDAGIPVVKVEDTSPDKFSVYKLTALQSTLGIFVASEWEKVRSADFVYMQDAYIERLQVELVTAEKIEALNIRTKNIEILEGAIVKGAIASPFERTTNLYGEAFSNNLIVTGNFTLPWDQKGSGRLIRLIQPSAGTSSCTAQAGKYFFEDGVQKNTITMLGAEILELLGYTDKNGVFIGWLVLNRGLMNANSTWGEPHRIVAHGRIKTNHPFKYHTFDGSVLTTSTGGASPNRYTSIIMPGAWFDNKEGYYVKITGNDGKSTAFHVVERITNYTFTVNQFSLNTADGRLNPSATFDFYFEVYSAAWLEPKQGSSGGGMPGENW